MVKPPTPEQLREISASYNLDLSDADVESFLGLIEGTLVSYTTAWISSPSLRSRV